MTRKHVTELQDALNRLRSSAPKLNQGGADLADVRAHGGRLLAAGNGGSVAQAA